MQTLKSAAEALGIKKPENEVEAGVISDSPPIVEQTVEPANSTVSSATTYTTPPNPAPEEEVHRVTTTQTTTTTVTEEEGGEEPMACETKVDEAVKGATFESQVRAPWWA